MTQATRERRPARLPITRPLMLTVFLALSACSVFSGKDTAGTRASGATPGNLAPEQSADTMLKVADETRAGADLEIAASKNTGDPRIFNALGVAHDLAGRHDLAQEDYRRGIALAPDQVSL